MEYFSSENGPAFVVDYAHTPKALELALQAVAEHSQGNVWCVFGCGGDRDSGKRPLMGAVAEKYASQVVLTNDNPRSESAEQIIEEILSGLIDYTHATVISDRKTAIEYAYQHASNDDVILLAGKGHEDYQLIGEQKLHFSDREEVCRLTGGVYAAC